MAEAEERVGGEEPRHGEDSGKVLGGWVTGESQVLLSCLSPTLLPAEA